MNDGRSALLTDLYQLTMLQGYHASGMDDTAVFEFFIRRLPENRHFLLAAGLEQLIDYLESLSFTAEELDWLASTRRFNDAFLADLADFRFTGDIDAMPEGTPCFADEPLLRVTAPLPEAQFVESRVINLLHFQTMIASKAVRCVIAAPDRQLVDFGMRRAHGAEAATLAARAAYLAGFSGTATVTAGMRFGIPLFGTMAHSFVQAHAGERDAFHDFALSQPDNVVLLIDTYDVETAAREVVGLAPDLATHGIRIKAVRIDSGDLGDAAQRVRAILDDGGLHDTGIFCSGNIDEYRLARLVDSGAPIDGYGIGTHMTTSQDAPNLDCAYKLQEYAGVARRKRSAGKATWPGRKQVWRRFDGTGMPLGDLVGLVGDPPPADSRALLEPMMRGGLRVAPAVPLETLRTQLLEQLRTLPDSLVHPAGDGGYPVEIASTVRSLAADLDDHQAATR